MNLTRARAQNSSTKRIERQAGIGLLALTSIVSLASPADAFQKLTIEPRSEARVTLTDNVFLTETDTLEDLDLSSDF